MIQRKPDNVTLFFIDETGAEYSANPLKWAEYNVLNAALGAQQEAARVNTAAQSHYLGALKSAQDSVSAHGPSGAEPPIKPLMQVVPDPKVVNGVLTPGDPTFVPFAPPLPDLVYATVTPSSGISNPNAPLDQQTQMLLSALMGISALLTKIAAKQGITP